jgi:hypothetical protein
MIGEKIPLLYGRHSQSREHSLRHIEVGSAHQYDALSLRDQDWIYESLRRVLTRNISFNRRKLRRSEATARSRKAHYDRTNFTTDPVISFSSHSQRSLELVVLEPAPVVALSDLQVDLQEVARDVSDLSELFSSKGGLETQ